MPISNGGEKLFIFLLLTFWATLPLFRTCKYWRAMVYARQTNGILQNENITGANVISYCSVETACHVIQAFTNTVIRGVKRHYYIIWNWQTRAASHILKCIKLLISQGVWAEKGLPSTKHEYVSQPHRNIHNASLAHKKIKQFCLQVLFIK